MKILFLDIETVPEFQSGDHVPSDSMELFLKRFRNDIIKECQFTNDFDGNSMEENLRLVQYYNKKASLYAEFGKVCCVSIGLLTATKFQIKAIASRNEKQILIELSNAIDKSQCNLLAAHNGLEFDFPFLMRRYIINGLPVPQILNPDGKKPWETPFIDTMKMWSGSAWNYKVSLELLAHSLGIPSPKTEMDGSKVAEVFYGSYKVASGELPFDAEDDAMKAIGKYSNGDVVTLYKVYCRLKGIEAVSDENILFA